MRELPVRHDDEASEVGAGRIPWKQPRLLLKKDESLALLGKNVIVILGVNNGSLRAAAASA